MFGIFIYDNFLIKVSAQRLRLIIELQESKEMEKSLKDKILKEQQKFSDLLVKYDDLRLSPLLSKETQVELTELQATVKEVNSVVQKVEVIQQYWNAKVTTLYVCTYHWYTCRAVTLFYISNGKNHLYVQVCHFKSFYSSNCNVKVNMNMNIRTHIV